MITVTFYIIVWKNILHAGFGNGNMELQVSHNR